MGVGHPGGLHRQQIPTDEFVTFISAMLDFLKKSLVHYFLLYENDLEQNSNLFSILFPLHR